MKRKIICLVLFMLPVACCYAQQAAPCNGPLSNKSFESLRENILQADHDDTKLETARSLISHDCFSSAQVARLCRLFVADASRLQVAEWAYPHTVDPGNYAKVNVVFEQDENKKALNDFINNTTTAH